MRAAHLPRSAATRSIRTGHRDLVIRQAIKAVEHTAGGNHVNLVTHANHGHLSEFLFDELAAEFGDEVDWEDIEQWGCGGHVVRVHV